jgi:uncharacterized protein (UPF0335 family)
MAKSKPSPRKNTARPKPKPSSKPKPRVARAGDNTVEGRAKPYMQRIESKLDELESMRGSYMADCKVVREDIKEILGEAKDAGIAVKALKGLIEYRKLERKQEKIADGFDDIDESATYDQLVEALGPLGFAAARAAGYREDADDKRDVRPRHMTQPDASASSNDNGSGEPRADEAELARVGRGREQPPSEAAPAGDAAVNENRTDGEQPTTH